MSGSTTLNIEVSSGLIAIGMLGAQLLLLHSAHDPRLLPMHLMHNSDSWLLVYAHYAYSLQSWPHAVYIGNLRAKQSEGHPSRGSSDC